MSSRLCGLELQLARTLSADPAACFHGSLARRLPERTSLDEFSVSVPGGRAPAVFFEPTQLGIVYENLIDNALHWMKDSRSRHLHLEIEPRGGQLRLLVEDSGCGVPLGDEERIFTLNVSARGLGHGRGLTIARDIVGEFGGQIVCLPGPGGLGGARFELRLRILNQQN